MPPGVAVGEAHTRRHPVSARQPRRVFRPHRDWLALDFILAAVGLVFLAVAVSGLATLAGAAADLSALSSDCGDGRCDHLGTLTVKQRTYFPISGYGGLYEVGPSPDYCALTLSLDVGTNQAAVAGPLCNTVSTPSPVTATIWHGRVVTVEMNGRSVPTYFHPSFGIVPGLLRLLALIPVALCVALIEVDIANHRHVWRVRRRLFGPRWVNSRGETSSRSSWR